MPIRRMLTIKNNFSCNLQVDLEPISLTYDLKPDGTVDVIATETEANVALHFGIYDGNPYVSVWPDEDNIRIERNGRDVFEEWN